MSEGKNGQRKSVLPWETVEITNLNIGVSLTNEVQPSEDIILGEKCVILAEVQFEARGLQCAEDKIASLPERINCESEEIVEAANIAISNLLPTKSRSLYDIAYNRFKKWCAEKNVQVYSENVLLAYFSENAKNYKSPTLWAQYSMVKSCLIIYDNIDISKFPKLIAFLKKTCDGYQAKKIENIDKE
ncbi:hypothetical protein NQ317_013860 [Molorchus minor]|uniref:Uncharacterized protein n=1 Tax=Molorchus minor TaxID=1323400 RepID=A0ABQ9K7F6_9CUCU|nr:hypothetical protein NQ317_013860 [Molorchus minor]